MNCCGMLKNRTPFDPAWSLRKTSRQHAIWFQRLEPFFLESAHQKLRHALAVTSGVVLVLLAIGGRRCVRTTLDVGLHRCWQLTTGGKKVSVQRRMEQRLRHEGQARDNEDECSTWCTRPRPFHSPYPRRNEVARCGKFSAGRHI